MGIVQRESPCKGCVSGLASTTSWFLAEGALSSSFHSEVLSRSSEPLITVTNAPTDDRSDVLRVTGFCLPATISSSIWLRVAVLSKNISKMVSVGCQQKPPRRDAAISLVINSGVQLGNEGRRTHGHGWHLGVCEAMEGAACAVCEGGVAPNPNVWSLFSA